MHNRSLDSAVLRRSRGAAGLCFWTLPCVWMAGAAAIALAGFVEDPYLQAVRASPIPPDYPSAMVVGLIAFTTVCSLSLQAILRLGSYRKSWGRALIAFMLALILLYMTAMAAIHAPPPLIACLYWLLSITISLACLLVWSAVQALRHRPVDEGQDGLTEKLG